MKVSGVREREGEAPVLTFLPCRYASTQAYKTSFSIAPKPPNPRSFMSVFSPCNAHTNMRPRNRLRKRNPKAHAEPTSSFSRLPQELQDLIWLWALYITTPPILTLRVSGCRSPRLLPPAPLAIFHVSFKVRELLLRAAVKTNCFHSIQDRQQRDQWVYFNPRCQILELHAEERFLERVFGLSPQLADMTAILKAKLPTLAKEVRYLHGCVSLNSKTCPTPACAAAATALKSLVTCSVSRIPLQKLHDSGRSWTFSEISLRPCLHGSLRTLNNAINPALPTPYDRRLWRLSCELRNYHFGYAPRNWRDQLLKHAVGGALINYVCVCSESPALASDVVELIPGVKEAGGELLIPVKRWKYSIGRYEWLSEGKGMSKDAQIFGIERDTYGQVRLRVLRRSRIELPFKEAEVMQDVFQGRPVYANGY
ncbi:hypothetical protein BU26DRAFT_88375 [Trematosphaeria pertusa]|uniref:2EXR domain-containing protein n=1 Tax=Trematosphaeria pertusa TaxID=390896 RepID=A0A6A6I4I8_9PLEO|nr:uncharacterized protein BU26DRAFT_88375 [Trematosphaeria pertusa]KAF2244872.1 hypothetical protein BU26DRAFT_88375 [Trematosphaeria pertusa]